MPGPGARRLRPPRRPRGVVRRHARPLGGRAAPRCGWSWSTPATRARPTPATDPAELTERRAAEVHAAAEVLGPRRRRPAGPARRRGDQRPRAARPARGAGPPPPPRGRGLPGPHGGVLRRQLRQPPRPPRGGLGRRRRRGPGGGQPAVLPRRRPAAPGRSPAAVGHASRPTPGSTSPTRSRPRSRRWPCHESRMGGDPALVAELLRARTAETGRAGRRRPRRELPPPALRLTAPRGPRRLVGGSRHGAGNQRPPTPLAVSSSSPQLRLRLRPASLPSTPDGSPISGRALRAAPLVGRGRGRALWRCWIVRHSPMARSASTATTATPRAPRMHRPARRARRGPGVAVVEVDEGPPDQAAAQAADEDRHERQHPRGRGGQGAGRVVAVCGRRSGGRHAATSRGHVPHWADAGLAGRRWADPRPGRPAAGAQPAPQRRARLEPARRRDRRRARRSSTASPARSPRRPAWSSALAAVPSTRSRSRRRASAGGCGSRPTWLSSYAGDLRVDDPDGIVVDAAFVDAERLRRPPRRVPPVGQRAAGGLAGRPVGRRPAVPLPASTATIPGRPRVSRR